MIALSDDWWRALREATPLPGADVVVRIDLIDGGTAQEVLTLNFIDGRLINEPHEPELILRGAREVLALLLVGQVAYPEISGQVELEGELLLLGVLMPIFNRMSAEW